MDIIGPNKRESDEKGKFYGQYTSEAMLNLKIKGRLRHKENQCKYFNSSKGPLVGRKIVILKKKFHSSITHKTGNNVMVIDKKENIIKLDPVGSTVRYEMMKLCTGSVKDTMRR